MKVQKIESPKGELALWSMEEGEKIATADDLLALLWNDSAPTLVLEREALAEAFFDLKTGLAGELLQKISNYRRRLAILGELSDLRSSALRAFVAESNRTGQVVFAPDLPAAIELLK